MGSGSNSGRGTYMGRNNVPSSSTANNDVNSYGSGNYNSGVGSSGGVSAVATGRYQQPPSNTIYGGGGSSSVSNTNSYNSSNSGTSNGGYSSGSSIIKPAGSRFGRLAQMGMSGGSADSTGGGGSAASSAYGSSNNTNTGTSRYY